MTTIVVMMAGSLGGVNWLLICVINTSDGCCDLEGGHVDGDSIMSPRSLELISQSIKIRKGQSILLGLKVLTAEC